MFTLRKLSLALAITGLLSTPLLAADTATQPVRILASLPITYGLGELLLKDSNVTLERAAAANLPGSRQSAYFNGRDRKSTRLNSSHRCTSRMPSSA